MQLMIDVQNYLDVNKGVAKGRLFKKGFINLPSAFELNSRTFEDSAIEDYSLEGSSQTANVENRIYISFPSSQLSENMR